MRKEIKVAFRKKLIYKGQIIFELLKTKTNRYYLVDYKTKEIVAENKNEILQKIKDWGGECKINEKSIKIYKEYYNSNNNNVSFYNCSR